MAFHTSTHYSTPADHPLLINLDKSARLDPVLQSQAVSLDDVLDDSIWNLPPSAIDSQVAVQGTQDTHERVAQVTHPQSVSISALVSKRNTAAIPQAPVLSTVSSTFKFDYCIFVQPRSKALADSKRAREPLVPPNPIPMFELCLSNLNMASFKSRVMVFLGSTRAWLYDPLIEAQEEGRLHWHWYIAKDRTYGQNQKRFLKTEADFDTFVEVLNDNIAKTINVKLFTDDPDKQSKKKDAASRGNETLEMLYGPADARERLEREEERTMKNKRCDKSSLATLISEIRNAHPSNVPKYRWEGPVLINPENSNEYLPINANTSYKWAAAILDRVPGVTVTKPPEGPDFQWHTLETHTGVSNSPGPPSAPSSIGNRRLNVQPSPLRNFGGPSDQNTPSISVNSSKAPSVQPPSTQESPAEYRKVLETSPGKRSWIQTCNSLDELSFQHDKRRVLAPPPVSPDPLEDYLAHAFIDINDTHTRRILAERKITHWTFFRRSTEKELQDMGMEIGAARQLCDFVGFYEEKLRTNDKRLCH